MADKKKPDPKTQVKDAKKKIKAEVKKLQAKTQKGCKELAELKKEHTELAKKKGSISPDEKKRKKDIDKIVANIMKSHEKYAISSSANINSMLQSYVPEDKSDLPYWKKNLDPWYRSMIEKESGIDIPGSDMKIWGDISFGKKEATIIWKGKF